MNDQENDIGWSFYGPMCQCMGMTVELTLEWKHMFFRSSPEQLVVDNQSRGPRNNMFIHRVALESYSTFMPQLMCCFEIWLRKKLLLH